MRNHSALTLLTAVALSGVFFVSLVHAGEGRLEINQACAEVGCFPGDPAGFPVNINQSGSYVLTGNLDFSGEDLGLNNPGIRVLADGVTIDLNGFKIIGPTTCSSGGNCTPLGNDRSNAGIRISSDKVTVRNGCIEGSAGSGVSTEGAYTVYENITVKDAGANGLKGGHNSRTSNCVVDTVQLVGIVLFSQSIAEGNIVTNTGLEGIAMGQGVTKNNTVRSAGRYGIQANGMIVNNAVVGAVSRGISASGNIIGNHVSVDNGTGALFISGGATGGAYSHNFLVNPSGPAVVSGTDLGQNFCNGSPTCP